LQGSEFLSSDSSRKEGHEEGTVGADLPIGR